jgi:hypothetical protein
LWDRRFGRISRQGAKILTKHAKLTSNPEYFLLAGLGALAGLARNACGIAAWDGFLAKSANPRQN